MAYVPYNDVGTNYQTPDGQYFRNESDAQNHLQEQEKKQRDWEEWERSMKKAIEEDGKALEALMDSYTGKILPLKNTAFDCQKRENWEGAVAAFLKIVNIFANLNWKEYEQRFRGFVKDNSKVEWHFNTLKEFEINYKAWLGVSYSKYGFQKFGARDFNGAISDCIKAIYIYPFNSDLRDSFFTDLAIYHAERGNAEDVETDSAADLSVALKFLPKGHKNYRDIAFTLPIFLVARANGTMNEASEAFEKCKDFATFQEACKQVYFDATRALKLSPTGEMGERAKNILKQFPDDWKVKFSAIPVPEEPAVQKILDEIRKGPADSQPKTITVSNDLPKKNTFEPQQQTSPAPQQQSIPPASSLPPNFSGMAEEHIFGNGDIYKGEWYNGKLHGRGKQIYANGNVYEGDFVENYLYGKGKMTLANGSTYEGDWRCFKDNKISKPHGKGKGSNPHGKGKMTCVNGDVYEGDFVNGNWHGKGKLIHPNGKVQEGNWENGEFKGKSFLDRIFG